MMCAGWLKEHVECYPNVKVVTFTLPAGVTPTVCPVAVGEFERVLGFLFGSDGMKTVAWMEHVRCGAGL